MKTGRAYDDPVTILDAERRARTDLDITHRAKAEFASSSAEKHYAPDLRLEPVHLEIDFHVDIPAETLRGSIRHTIRCNDEGAHAITLNGIDLRELEVPTEGVDAAYDGNELQLVWETPFERGDEREVEIRYQVHSPASGLFFSSPSEALPDAPVFAVTDHETERARHWLCTIDLPSVRPTLVLRLRADAALTILANGSKTGETTHDDGTKTVTWTLEQRCPSYLTCFAIGDFVEWTDEDLDGKPIAAYAPASLYEAEHLERAFRRTRDMLQWIPQRLGVPFPYPKYFQFAVPGIGGAMENISLVSWDDRFLLDDALETEERQLLDVINLHEMAHTWFGDWVVCRDYAHAWLKESWATYMETCWLEHDLGKEAADYDLWTSARNYIRECEERYVRPIYTRRFESSWDMYDYHLYPGGAWRLHMLRKSLGEDVFWSAVTLYLQRHGDDRVETADFRRALEETCGRSLARFFDQWIESPGYPKLEGRFRWNAKTREGTFELQQTQEDSKKGIGRFEFDLDLAWWIDGERHVRTVRFDSKRITQTIAMPKEPTRVRLDPDLKVLHDPTFDVGDARLREQLQHDDVFGRILAGRALASSGKAQNLRAVVAQLRRETYWGVQIQLAEALGNAKHEIALQGLCDTLAEHDEVRSSAAVFRALGEYRDPRVTRAIEARLDGELTPRAAEAALESLGKQRDAAPRERLETAAAQRGFGGFAQAGAMRGLAESHQDVGDALRSLVQPGAAPIQVRPHGVLALGSWAARADRSSRKPFIEALEDLLRDPSHKVRAAAAGALCTARSTDSLAALQAYRDTLPEQEQIRLDRRLRSLRRGDGNRTLKRVEDLEDRFRKLTTRLEKLETKQ